MYLSAAVTGFEQPLESAGLVEELLEPELVDLVDDDEEHLVMLGPVAERLLQLEELVHLEVGGVGQGIGRGAQKGFTCPGCPTIGGCGRNMVSTSVRGTTLCPGMMD